MMQIAERGQANRRIAVLTNQTYACILGNALYPFRHLVNDVLICLTQGEMNLYFRDAVFVYFIRIQSNTIFVSRFDFTITKEVDRSFAC
ncbi:hypothetical protein D3C86_2082860 [compost metagenome]